LLKLNDISARYDAVVLAKSTLEKKHTQSEEQNLVYKKALLNSQIDNGKLSDQSDNQNFDLTNKVMSLQKETMESGLRIDSLSQENSNIKTDLSQLKHERNSLTIELDSLRANYAHLDKDNKSTKRKMDELGIEIVNLANTKKGLLTEKEEKGREIQKIQKQYG
jgi:chromosome segregation ATPase